MPPASRHLDVEGCPAHGSTPIVTFSPDVFIGYRHAGRQFDILACAPPDMIVEGSPTVFINHRQAARISDPTAHSGRLATGFPTVFIGETGQGFTLAGAAANGQPFCEECEKARRAAAHHDVPAPPAELPEPPQVPPLRLRGVSDEEVRLAAEDGSSAAQVAARRKVAAAFYEQQGFKYDRVTDNPRPHTLSELTSELNCIDYAKPVSFGPPPALEEQLDQWQSPGSKQGQYYAAANTPPEALGVLPFTAREGQNFMMKESKTHSMMPHPYLRSTAAPADVNWGEVEGHALSARGGAIQIYMPDRSFAPVVQR